MERAEAAAVPDQSLIFCLCFLLIEFMLVASNGRALSHPAVLIFSNPINFSSVTLPPEMKTERFTFGRTLEYMIQIVQ